MVFAGYLIPLLALSSQALASYTGNLNYRSPSLRHARLGIDLEKVTARSLSKRDEAPYEPSQLNFTHGVASGDPYADSVVLWTRVAPSMESDESDVTVSGDVPLYDHETEGYVRASAHPVCVKYRVFDEEGKKKVVDQGTVWTSSDIDYTVKVEAKGLDPFTTYYYQFNTAPAADGDTEEIKLAVHSCSQWPNGYFNSYGNVVRKDNVDYVVHLGDYIYEYGPDAAEIERVHSPRHEIFTLHDYRARLGQYRTDLDLATSHQNFAWIPVWDDHEIANNGYRDGFSGLNNTEDSFLNVGPKVSIDQRKMDAVGRTLSGCQFGSSQVDMDDGLRIWRSFQMGNLMDLIMLDTRNYDRSITSLGWNDEYIERIQNDTGRSLMGARQENWFYRHLSDSASRGTTWRVIGSQLKFSRLEQEVDGGVTVSLDSWDGYRAHYNRTLKHLYDNNIGNNIMLAGDTHTNWVSDLAWIGEKSYDSTTGKGAVGVEFAGTAVSSEDFGGTISSAEAEAATYKKNEEMRWTEGYYRGCYELHVTQNEVQAEYFGCPTVASRNGWDLPLANFTVKTGENHLARSVAGGEEVEAGYFRDGEVKHSNLTLNTETGKWEVIGFDQMFLMV
ncbi:alkaline phosphatase D family protein [Aspergillus glaucus CBS 516.65]|uniref:PhoD-like phosphatase metallophosphatase domain-containing protein n=1 Tax=Aspergillus glaucus CBS 516.65 TaxID=1160497 RepID=A0A1L9VZ55_ASPGL|nr:hypothetical protein ASPGLDRAFT_70984 [Aspergillus glaucus CBS 516.65]OJJ89210.1 hypothetical protein ASPGLDRAFT_70984 [Aspergillus glaucus CBS 516.65]